MKPTKPIVVTDPDMKELQHNYNLTVPALQGLCNSNMDETCCSCMKKKACNDIGCASQFGGQGKYFKQSFDVVLSFQSMSSSLNIAQFNYQRKFF